MTPKMELAKTLLELTMTIADMAQKAAKEALEEMEKLL